MPVAAQTASGGFRYRAATGSDGDQSQISVADNEGGAYTMQLTWRCAGDSGYHLFVSGTPLTGDSVLAAQWRFDQDAPDDASWAVTPNHAWARNEVNAFTSRALTAREVSIRLTNAGGSFITATFSLQGAREAMSRLACLRQLAAVP